MRCARYETLSLPPFAFSLSPSSSTHPFALRVPALDHRLSFYPTFCDLFIGDERQVNRAPRGKQDTPGFEMPLLLLLLIIDSFLARSKRNAFSELERGSSLLVVEINFKISIKFRGIDTWRTT